MKKKNTKSVNQSLKLTLPEVFTSICEKYKGSLLKKAVFIFTPLPGKKRLNGLKLSSEAIEFIKQYEPLTITEGLFSHQFQLLNSYAKGADNFILTSATGSGKSLCFWSWVVDQLVKDTNATALLCFPTQALMWGQADRLTRISNNHIIYDEKSGNPYAGTLHVGNKQIDWTVWKGVGHGQTTDPIMKKHEKSDEFTKARIRLATLDKAHWSLIGKKNAEFTKKLKCVVLDEAHQYDGIFGANVLYFLKRLYIAKETARKNKPNIFLASATLTDAKSFAAKLLSISEKDIHHVKDSVEPDIKTIPIDQVLPLIKNPPVNGLSRFAIFVDSIEEKNDFEKLLSDFETIGNQINILFFSESKFQSRILKHEIEVNKQNKRKNIIYDADLPPNDRRQIETQFNKGTMAGGTLIATSALELGIDVENLDLCVLGSNPPKRADFIQRIGRVGRRQDHPGIVLLNLTAAPFDRFISKNLGAAFAFETSKSVPIPSDLEMLRLRHMTAAHYEGCYRYYANGDWNHYKDVFKRHFGEFLEASETKKILEELYSGLLDMSGNSWVHKGFRASASEGKIPLRKYGQENSDIAWIEDINIFRDAHPEAVYLDANGRRWRVISYSGGWKEANWEHPESNVILAKYLKSIDVVYVKQIKELITTRGLWEESMNTYKIIAEPPDGVEYPANGNFEYGIWEYSKKFTGYKVKNLSTKESHQISLSEIKGRFKNAVEQGKDFPFLFPLSYRTYGWAWNFEVALKGIQPEILDEIEGLVNKILTIYFADAVQANPVNLQICFSLSEGYLKVIDASPGGNGLSEALLRDDQVSSAFSNILETLNQYKGSKMKKKFKSYVLQLYKEEIDYDASEVIEIIKQIQSYWTG